MLRKVESGEVKKRYHFFGHVLLKRKEEKNNSLMDNQQHHPGTQEVEDKNNYLERMRELETLYNKSTSYLDRRDFMEQIKALEAEISLNYNNKNNYKPKQR